MSEMQGASEKRQWREASGHLILWQSCCKVEAWALGLLYDLPVVKPGPLSVTEGLLGASEAPGCVVLLSACKSRGCYGWTKDFTAQSDIIVSFQNKACIFSKLLFCLDVFLRRTFQILYSVLQSIVLCQDVEVLEQKRRFLNSDALTSAFVMVLAGKPGSEDT